MTMANPTLARDSENRPHKKRPALFLAVAFFLVSSVSVVSAGGTQPPYLTAKSAIVVNPKNGGILYSKNPHLKLPPASITKLMTVLLAIEKLSLTQEITVGSNAVKAAPSKAGLTLGAQYRVMDLVAACLVSSSNDAAIALAEAVAGSEKNFAVLMNERAAGLGMTETRFVNATGLTDKRKKQYSTAYDLTLLMRAAVFDPRIDKTLGITTTSIRGSDGKTLFLKNHNKMLWRMPKAVKGKTGWTYASRHTFVGTDYDADKKIIFAMLSSKKPWLDIERLATFGLLCLKK